MGLKTKLKPLGDKVVIKQIDEKAVTTTGIVLPTSSKEKSQQAEVVAVGNGGVVDGKEVVMEVSVGDVVIYSEFAGTKVKLEGQEYIILRQNDILAIVE